MENFTVVFDTNSYRDLFDRTGSPQKPTVSQIRSNEQSRNIVSLANWYVLQELASHLQDPTEPRSYRQCASAVSAMFHHCRSGTEDKVRWCADSESQMATYLYGICKDNRAAYEMCQTLLEVVASSWPNELPPFVADFAKRSADFLDAAEKAFIDDMQRGKFKRDPQKVARHYVAGVRASIGKSPLDYNDPEMAQDATDVLNAFGPQIELFAKLCGNLATGAGDMTKQKKPNLMWDMKILAGIGHEIETIGRLHLVTGDKEMRKASTAVGLVQYIHSLDEYLALIGL